MSEKKELLSVKKGNILIEGKTKRVFECIGDELPHINVLAVAIQFKPDITAKDGEEHEIIIGKDEIDCVTNDNFFRLLNACGIPTHYMGKLHGPEFLARRLVHKANYEVVTRRVATGSYLGRHPETEEGYHFKDLCTEFFYKDDLFKDPMIDSGFIKVKDAKGYFATMKNINGQAFLTAEEVLRQLGYQLIDWKLEYGWPTGSTMPLLAADLVVIDEITAGNIRVWPIKEERLDLSVDNILSQLDPDGMLDKQLFREGKDLETVKTAFESLADLTSRFSEFYPQK